jgi:ribosome biogenesis protein Tsr3
VYFECRVVETHWFVILEKQKKHFLNFLRLQDKSTAVDRDAQLSECIYYQWDAFLQRLHVIQRRLPVLVAVKPANGCEALVYTALVVNAKGQFDSIVSEDFKTRAYILFVCR